MTRPGARIDGDFVRGGGETKEGAEGKGIQKMFCFDQYCQKGIHHPPPPLLACIITRQREIEKRERESDRGGEREREKVIEMERERERK